MPKPDLRAFLQASAAGKHPAPRGNVVADRDINAASPFAKACNALVLRSRQGDGDDGIPAPSTLLPLIA